MGTKFTWRLGRRFDPDQGLWLAETLTDAVRLVPEICRAVGYRERDVHIWRDGSWPRYWVARPHGQGGIGADTLEEAKDIQRAVGPELGVLVIRQAESRQSV